MFLNLSNHPSDLWPPAQRAQAEALGGPLLDEPFPEVPPEASPEQVAVIGAALVSRISSMAPTAAMIQGEFTLAFYLVQELESRGIHCYAATSRRVAETTVLPGGTVDKETRFEFVRLRRYTRASGT